jgi:2'-5' RNA ligase
VYDDFLQQLTTTAHHDRDFNEWHGGVEHYGFWAICIASKPWQNLYKDAREHIQGLVLKDYLRQAHITVSSCGLLAPQHFSKQQFKLQHQALLSADLSGFTLSAGPLNSFAGSPYISIGDPKGGLAQLRQVLHTIITEDSPAIHYSPHITLGLYADAFHCPLVVECLKRFQQHDIADLYVDQICFCRYNTDSIQGRFEVIERIALTAQHCAGSDATKSVN